MATSNKNKVEMVFQRYYQNDLTSQDCSDIQANLTNFFDILIKIEKRNANQRDSIHTPQA